MTLKLTTARTLQPITRAEAKLHLRVDASDEDALIDALIVAATDDAEHLMSRAVLPQTWTLYLDDFCADQIDLQRPPVTAITTVKYLQASDGALTTLPDTEYTLAAGSDYTARVLPAYGKAWPATRDMPEAVQIAFVCGYANAAAVPEPIKAWIKLRIGALYENRQAWTLGKAIERNPHVDHLLDRYRVWSL